MLPTTSANRTHAARPMMPRLLARMPYVGVPYLLHGDKRSKRG